jgi:hypothetical protein
MASKRKVLNAGNQRRRARTRGRKLKVYERYLEGTCTQRQVAEEFGITPGRVCQLIHEMDAEILEGFSEKRGALKARQYGQLEHVAREAMRAWEQSQKPSETTKTKRTDGVPGDQTETTTSHRPGDPRYLDQALKAMDGIRKIWGLETLSSRPANAEGEEQLNQTTNIIGQLKVYLNDDRARDALGTLAAQLPALEQDRHAGTSGGDGVRRPVEDGPTSGTAQSQAD